MHLLYLKKKKFYRTLFFILVVGVTVYFGSITSERVDASMQEKLRGFAWGGGEVTDTNGGTAPNNGLIDGDENGIGWISFNSTDCDTDDNEIVDVVADVDNNGQNDCGSLGSTIRRYGVSTFSASGPVIGYAWSEHYGWISFNETDLQDKLGVPDSACNPVLAQAMRSGNNITGGARIIAIQDAIEAGNAGGFDGCISLSGTGYGVTVSGTSLSGYAWSSDLGWIDMSGVSIVVPAPPGLTLTASPDGFPTGGGNTTLTWTVSDATSCTASSNPANSGWDGPQTATNGTHSQSGISVGADTVFTLSCSNGVGSTIRNRIVTVAPPPASCTAGTFMNCMLPPTNHGSDGAGTCSIGGVSCGYTCNDGGWINPTGGGCNPPTAIPSLIAKPRLLEAGRTGQLEWNTNGTSEAGCTLTGGALSNSNTILIDDTTAVGGTEDFTGSYPIDVYAMTTYTLTCGAQSDTATFEIVPRGFET